MQAGVYVPDDFAEQIAGAAAQDALRLRIDVVKPPIAIHGKKGVGNAFEDGAGLMAELLLIQSFLLGAVALAP